MASDMVAGGLNIGSTFISTLANISDIKARSKATLDAIDAESNSYQIQQNILLEQDADLERELGDVMSQNALKAMQAEARLRAGAAETGTAGGTTSNAVKEAYMIQTLDNAILISRKRQSETDIARRSLMVKVGFDNRMQELQGSMVTPLGAGLSTLTAGMRGFQTGYSLMNSEQRYEAFGGDYSQAGAPTTSGTFSDILGEF